jgi:hypothetical protein
VTIDLRLKLCLLRKIKAGCRCKLPEWPIYVPATADQQNTTLNMAEKDGGTPLRRSTRQRKDISYKDIEKAAEIPDTPNSRDDEFNQSPRNLKRGPKPKPFEPTPRRISTDIRANSIYSTSREGRIYSIAGSDESVQLQIFEKMEKWRNVYDEVPDELLDYTVGWGVCTGDWNGNAGDRQKAKIFPYSLIQSAI